MTQVTQFTDANWYIFEILDSSENVLWLGLTKNPNQRLNQLTRLKPHKERPNSSYGMFYGQNVTMNVVAGFDQKKEALEALEILKEESDPDYERKKAERKVICSRAGRATVESGNHNMQVRYRCPDGHVTTKMLFKRYCLRHGLDSSKAEKLN